MHSGLQTEPYLENRHHDASPRSLIGKIFDSSSHAMHVSAESVAARTRLPHGDNPDLESVLEAH